MWLGIFLGGNLGLGFRVQDLGFRVLVLAGSRERVKVRRTGVRAEMSFFSQEPCTYEL